MNFLVINLLIAHENFKAILVHLNKSWRGHRTKEVEFSISWHHSVQSHTDPLAVGTDQLPRAMCLLAIPLHCICPQRDLMFMVGPYLSKETNAKIWCFYTPSSISAIFPLDFHLFNFNRNLYATFKFRVFSHFIIHIEWAKKALG